MKCFSAIVFLGAVAAYVTAYPLHASCKLTWNFTVNCSFVNLKLVDQMKTWSGGDCGSGEKCMYKVTSVTAGQVMGTHTTPRKHYVDNLTFSFTNSSSGCSVKGFSTSETWYAYLDYGTNYCNLRNLADGAGLTVSKYGFKEETNDSVCTQYSSHNCAKY